MKNPRVAVTLLKASLAIPLLSTLGLAVAAQQSNYERPPVNYSKSKPADPVAELDARLTAGAKNLPFDESHGYLRGLLEALQIPVSSQSLVFSKTSFQRQLIAPWSPRALYFNDDTYIGWVQGSDVLEIASIDPQLGADFYVLEQDPAKPVRFVRQTDNCLQCHDSTALTLGVPGVTVRSVFPGFDGNPRLTMGSYRTTYQSPILERWGGWYVTGEHGAQRHMGNLIFPEDRNVNVRELAAEGANRTDLVGKFNLRPYLTGTSDIVALMILEYQTTVQNLIIRANHDTRLALLQNDDLQSLLHEPLRPLTEATVRRIGYAADPLLEALLFSGETALTDPIKGNTSFATEFEKRGPLDRKGRSLRQLDLSKRMFKYPLSYLIYSKSFAGLPPETREYLSRHLYEILTGRDARPEFSHLTAEDKQAILEIVKDTAPEFAAGWK